jgi:uncharacterized membrane protein YGL010W
MTMRRSLTDFIAQYAGYHRNARNVATHTVGIPMIVLAVLILLSRPVLSFDGWHVTPAWFTVVFAGVFYLRLDLRLGLVMTLLLALCAALADEIASLGHGVWLSAGLGLFVAGWILQAVGHVFEGRKPAFFDDLTGLLIGPLFIVVEAGFLFGLLPELQRAVHAAESK